jgi:hypothetical protein
VQAHILDASHLQLCLQKRIHFHHSNTAECMPKEYVLHQQSEHQPTCRDLPSCARPRLDAPYAANLGVAFPSAPAPCHQRLLRQTQYGVGPVQATSFECQGEQLAKVLVYSSTYAAMPANYETRPTCTIHVEDVPCVALLLDDPDSLLHPCNTQT